MLLLVLTLVLTLVLMLVLCCDAIVVIAVGWLFVAIVVTWRSCLKDVTFGILR